MLDKLAHRRVLLLQGPVGPFFRRFAQELESLGATVHKVDFNAGDKLFYLGKRSTFFRGPLSAWPARLEQILTSNNIDVVCLFGDRRPCHKAAIPVCERLGVPVFVFEEGYLRPNHITMEEGGVNGRSPMSHDPDHYRNAKFGDSAKPHPVENPFPRFAAYSVIYALAHSICWWMYPSYHHHRSLNICTEAVHWARAGLRKVNYRRKEKGLAERLSGPLSNRYFLVALQVHLDAQIEHAFHNDVADFIAEVVRSFARHAPADVSLVVKHHPLDRGYRDYTKLLGDLGAQLGLGDRLLYVHDLHLPTLLKHSRGVVMMNSTVGLSSLGAGTPVKLLGKAIYDMPGLTFQGSLEEFWHSPGKVDRNLYRALVAWMVTHNQANGNFYRKLREVPTPTGIAWPRSQT